MSGTCPIHTLFFTDGIRKTSTVDVDNLEEYLEFVKSTLESLPMPVHIVIDWDMIKGGLEV